MHAPMPMPYLLCTTKCDDGLLGLGVAVQPHLERAHATEENRSHDARVLSEMPCRCVCSVQEQKHAMALLYSQGHKAHMSCATSLPLMRHVDLRAPMSACKHASACKQAGHLRVGGLVVHVRDRVPAVAALPARHARQYLGHMRNINHQHEHQ